MTIRPFYLSLYMTNQKITMIFIVENSVFFSIFML